MINRFFFALINDRFKKKNNPATGVLIIPAQTQSIKDTIMKSPKTILPAICIMVAIFLSCSNGPTQTATAQLDTTVIGKWQGAIAIPPLISGVKVNINIYRTDSLFSLIARNVDLDTTLNPAIKDTSLALYGTWRLNTARDSIKLSCDTSRIIDTAQHILTPRAVRGQIIPIFVTIARNSANGSITWDVPLTDIVPLAPLLGINLSLIPAILLQGQIIQMVKQVQL